MKASLVLAVADMFALVLLVALVGVGLASLGADPGTKAYATVFLFGVAIGGLVFIVLATNARLDVYEARKLDALLGEYAMDWMIADVISILLVLAALGAVLLFVAPVTPANLAFVAFPALMLVPVLILLRRSRRRARG